MNSSLPVDKKTAAGQLLFILQKIVCLESGFQDAEVAGLIHQEVVKLYSDTGLVSDEALQEFIVNAKDTLRVSRDVSFSEIADLSFARKAASELREGR
jgi:hypothetical protein